MKKIKFLPNPIETLANLSDLDKRNVILTVLHGSYLYEDNRDLPDISYIDTRVYIKNKILRSEFKQIKIDPDVDILMIVKDKDKSKDVIDTFLIDNNICKNMSYCMTINVVDLATAVQEIKKEGTSAIKTILTISPHKFIYKNELGDDLLNIAKRYITLDDKQLIKEYYERKTLIRSHARSNIRKFIIDRREYKEDYPLLMKHYEGKYYSGFPQKREKIELPKKIILKQRLDLDKDNFISNAHGI
jgi:hypothetical protein